MNDFYYRKRNEICDRACMDMTEGKRAKCLISGSSEDTLYCVNIDGREEKLPIITLSSSVKIAFFNLHGNTFLTEYCGKKLAELLMSIEVDVLLTAESKGLQLTHVVARELGHEFYVVARKDKKIYMSEFIETSVKAITGEVSHSFFISKADSQKLTGKRVAIVDDVISSGGSLKGLKNLIEKSLGKHIASACVFAEGDSVSNEEIIRLANLPLL